MLMNPVKSPNQLHIFDPWDFLSPKRRQMLDTGWPGLFKEHILPTLPVDQIIMHFDSQVGRPSKELYAMLGALVLQQAFDLPICPVKKGNKHYFIHFNAKQARIALRRRYERSDTFTAQYRWRAGVEATMSEYDRRTGVKRLRVRGMKAVRLCAVLKALAINIFRTAAVRAARMAPDPAPCMP